MKPIEKSNRDLQQLEKDFASWRSRNKGKRIPEKLWDEAVRLSQSLGVGRVARATRLFYPSLRSRSENAKVTGRSSSRRRSPGGMSFVEVPLSLTEPAVGSKQSTEPRLFFRFQSWLGTVKVEWV